jgi:osmoprotectant transport system permease protein
MADLLEHLPAYVGGHLRVSALSLAVGLLVSLPLGVAVSRGPRWLVEVALSAAGVVQTVPSLALLALMVPLLHATGFGPAFVALTLYSLLPILVNTVVGLHGVDSALVEAARGLGMNERQVLFRVQLPLALPVIIGGIRTATVLVVGTATLVTPVGGVSLGNYIFEGLESMNPVSTVFGCVVAALLAVLMDQLVHLLEVASRRRSRRLARAGAVGLLLLFAGGLVGPVAGLFRPTAPEAVIATGPFTEQSILSHVLADRARAGGLRPERLTGMSEGIQIQALRDNQIDCMVNYSGNIWALVMKRTDYLESDKMLAEVSQHLRERYGITLLCPLGFQDNYALAVRGDAARGGVRTIGDLRRFARPGRKVKLAGDMQFFGRPEWQRVKEVYDLADIVEYVEMTPTLMYGALAEGQCDAIVAYSSDGRIPYYGFELLGDPGRTLPPYDAILLLSPAAARRPELVAALEPLRGSINDEAMRKANRRVDVDRWTPRQAAEELGARLGGAGPAPSPVAP